MQDAGENQKIQKIAKLLEMGGTMLGSHHECGAPMFRFQGKTVCPVCDFYEQEKRTEAQLGRQKEHEITEERQWQKEINRLVVNKVLNIATGLENESDLARLKDKMGCIELGIKIIKLLGD